MAVLMNNTLKYFGGGTLISSRRVLTGKKFHAKKITSFSLKKYVNFLAAHCIHNKNQIRRLARDIKVMFGAHDLEDFAEEGRRVFAPFKTIVHPDWLPHGTNYDADIAMIEFMKDIAFDDFIQPICLWNFNFGAAFRKATVIGYGKSQDRTKEHEMIPKELEALITSNEYCVWKEPEIAELSSPRTFCFGDDYGSVPCSGTNFFYLKF
jgi:hypothetical protein